MAASCIYLASKLDPNANQLKLRDLINVVYTTLHRKDSGAPEEPLKLESQYYNIREAICHGELLVLRMSNFQVNSQIMRKEKIYEDSILFDLFADKLRAAAQDPPAPPEVAQAVDVGGRLGEVSDRQDELVHPAGLLPRPAGRHARLLARQPRLHRPRAAVLRDPAAVHGEPAGLVQGK